MSSAYPGSLDSVATDKAGSTEQGPTDHANHHNLLGDAVNKIEAELGANPSGTYSTVAAALLAALSLTREARSSNTILAVADSGKVIAASATFTQTLTAAATLGAGWWCIVQNNTSDGATILTVDPNGAETINGAATLTMYSGDTRVLLCDGSNFFTLLLSGGFVRYRGGAFGTWIKPTGITWVHGKVVGCGGGGGGGGSFVNTAACGGSGGGGGGIAEATWLAADLPATLDYEAPSGTGDGGSAWPAGANHGGFPGGIGGPAQIGRVETDGTIWLTAQGGDSGVGGKSTSAQTVAGGNGGTASGEINTVYTSGAGNNAVAGQSPPGVVGADGKNGEFGGGAGGGSNAVASASKGGSSLRGAGGGGGGGGVTAGNVGKDGGDGGASGSYVAGAFGSNSGGAATANHGVGGGTPTVGGVGVATQTIGAGGGGGGGSSAGGGGGRDGGAGAFPGGGGGGGGSGSNSSASGNAGGAGGDGGDAVVEIAYW